MSEQADDYARQIAESREASWTDGVPHECFDRADLAEAFKAGFEAGVQAEEDAYWGA